MMKRSTWSLLLALGLMGTFGALALGDGGQLTPGGLSKCTASSAFTGNCTNAVPLDLTHACASNQTLIWNGTSWGCGNSAPSDTLEGTVTSPDLLVASGAHTVTTYTGSTSSACSTGTFAAQVALSTAGVLTTPSCLIALTPTTTAYSDSTTIISATASGATTDWDPALTGTMANVQRIRLAPTGATTIYGMLAGACGQRVSIYNYSTTTSFTLVNEGGSETTASRRFTLQNVADFTMFPGNAIELLYSCTTSRWTQWSFTGIQGTGNAGFAALWQTSTSLNASQAIKEDSSTHAVTLGDVGTGGAINFGPTLGADITIAGTGSYNAGTLKLYSATTTTLGGATTFEDRSARGLLSGVGAGPGIAFKACGDNGCATLGPYLAGLIKAESVDATAANQTYTLDLYSGASNAYVHFLRGGSDGSVTAYGQIHSVTDPTSTQDADTQNARTLYANGSGGISPTALTSGSNTNNWNPTSLHTVSYVDVTTSTSSTATLTGMNAGVDGEEKTLCNYGPGAVTIKNNDTTDSTAANVFQLAGGADVTLPAATLIGGCITVRYRSADTAWIDIGRAIGLSSTGGLAYGTSGLGLAPCGSASQIPEWNGSSWVCINQPGGSGFTGGGTTNDLAIWTSSTGLGNYAGADSGACTSGQFITRIQADATGALTKTCAGSSTTAALSISDATSASNQNLSTIGTIDWLAYGNTNTQEWGVAGGSITDLRSWHSKLNGGWLLSSFSVFGNCSTIFTAGANTMSWTASDDASSSDSTTSTSTESAINTTSSHQCGWRWRVPAPETQEVLHIIGGCANGGSGTTTCVLNCLLSISGTTASKTYNNTGGATTSHEWKVTFTGGVPADELICTFSNTAGSTGNGNVQLQGTALGTT